MKDIFKLFSLGIFALLMSCGDSTAENNAQQSEIQHVTKKPLTDTLVYISKNHDRTFPECEGDDCPTYTLDYIEVEDAQYSFINDSIKVALIGKSTSMDEAADDFLYEADESGSIQPWTYDVTTKVEFNKKGLFAVSYSSYAYMGGAHGMPGFLSDNFNLETKQKLSLYDMFNIKDSIALQDLGEKYFRIDNDIDAKADLNYEGFFWENDFYLSNTFTLTNDGLMFIYSAYEIGPYSIGMPQFTIPYAALESLLTENSPLKRLF